MALMSSDEPWEDDESDPIVGKCIRCGEGVRKSIVETYDDDSLCDYCQHMSEKTRDE